MMNDSILKASQQARKNIFSKLREAPTTAVKPLDPLLTATLPVVSFSHDQEKIENFIIQAKAWHAEVIECNDSEWPSHVEKILEQVAAPQLLAGRNTAIAEKLLAQLGTEKLRWFDEPIESWKPSLFNDVAISMTTTLGAIALTGTLILWPDELEPRTMSLVPPIHIALLYASQIQATLASAQQYFGWAQHMPTNLLMISGPSKTADIQQTLAYGAHGPKQLLIVLVRDDLPDTAVGATS